MASENGNNNQVNGPPPTGELRGERFTLNLTKGPQVIWKIYTKCSLCNSKFFN